MSELSRIIERYYLRAWLSIFVRLSSWLAAQVDKRSSRYDDLCAKQPGTRVRVRAGCCFDARQVDGKLGTIEARTDCGVRGAYEYDVVMDKPFKAYDGATWTRDVAHICDRGLEIVS